jgi:16S rRNA (adenine1518-N6/adenine1519-N6)-dimethyltransferase
MSFNFKRRYGQNFLRNFSIIRKIAKRVFDTASRFNNLSVYEIGPGDGALSRELLNLGLDLMAIEIDVDCIEKVQHIPNMKVVLGDALNYDFAFQGVVGNLPYNISTQLLIKFIKKPIPFGIFMLQREVATRILSNNSERLNIMLRSRYDLKSVLRAKASDFYPAPKVDSQVIEITKHDQNSDLDIDLLEKVVRIIFLNKRKKIAFLKKSMEDDFIAKIISALEILNVDWDLRAEKISQQTFYDAVRIMQN